MVNLAQYSPSKLDRLSCVNLADASMTQNEIEHWICVENIARFQKILNEPTDKAPRNQIEDLLTRELAKLLKMFPD